jgi:F-type H+-transporting ATPase subunit b
MEFSFFIAAAQAAETAVQETSPSFIGTLGLNWKLFFGQLVNFGIVIFVLWKWVFTPLTDALEKRRRTIEDGLRKAEEYEQQLQTLEERKREEIGAAKKEASGILQKAADDGAAIAREMAEKAKRAAEKIAAEAKAEALLERDRILQEAREELANLVTMATERLLRRKLDGEADRELIRQSIQEVRKQ